MKRANSKQQKDQLRRERYEKERWFLLSYSLKDEDNGEIVHTTETAKIVTDKIKLNLGDGYAPITAEYGEVLNRFSPKITVTKNRSM